MRKALRILVLAIGVLGQKADTQTLTEYFGSGTNQISIEFVEIGNPGNAADVTGFGSVAFTYNLGKYEISRDMINKANEAGGLGISIADLTNFGGNGGSRPATGISWYEAARFVNYLNTSQAKQVAYKFDGNGNLDLWGAGQYNGSNQFRHKDAYYFLPSVDEWYKGAYYDSNKSGGPGYWKYPTGMDSDPISVSGGTNSGSLVYGNQSGPADINDAGGLSAYNTMGQGGNAWEWTENAFDALNDTPGENRVLRGGSWEYAIGSFNSSYSLQGNIQPGGENYSYGFRVASVPEPSSLSLLALGGVLVALGKRRY